MNLDGFNAENEDAGGVSLFDLVDDLDVIVWEADPETFDFIFVNRRAVVLLGYEREEWYEPDFWAGRLIHPDDRAQTVAVCRAAVQERRDHFIEYRAVAADGRVVWLRDMIRVITGELGGIQALRGAMLDVTAEKATEAELALERQQLEQLAEERRIALEALQRSEAHYRRLVNTEPYGVFVTDAAGNLLEVNRSGAEIVGREPDELLGTHFSALIHPDSLDYANQMFAQLMSGPARPIEFELKVAHRDGSSRLLSIAAAPIIVDGRAVGVHGAGRDITQERAADARRRLLAVALDNLPDAVSLTDRSLRFVYTNRAHAQLFGYEPGNPPADVLGALPDEESQRQIQEIFAALGQERRWAGRMRRRRADGSVMLTSATVFAVSDGNELYALTVMRDAAEEISRDQHLRRVERLASLATLIGGVAHELNNPLTAVLGFARLMLLEERSQEDRETLETIAREAERAARIVADLRLIARDTQDDEPSAERAPVDLNQVVRDVLERRRYSLESRGIEVREDLAAELPLLNGSRSQLEQVVVNLVANAEQALERTGDQPRRLRVETRTCPRGISLHVADNGPGILRQHLDRVFDPFFTTKAPGQGMGLGLSLAHSVVLEHGGSMRVESTPDLGAEFIVELPLADADRPATATAAAARPLRVLVVDDEAGIRAMLARALGRRGHQVMQAADGEEALRMLDDAGAFDVVVSDLHMPGLGGDELLRQLSERHPGLADRVVFITGDAASARNETLRQSGVPVLLKPFPLEQAAALIERRARDQGASSSAG